MLGTLNGALEVRGIELETDDISAEGRGINELREGVPVLTRIEIDYSLCIPAGSKETVDRALAKHQAKCPTAATLRESVEISWSAEIEEKSG